MPRTILVQLKNRCEAFTNVCSKFDILNHKTLIEVQEVEIINKVKELVEKYPDDLTKNLASELIQIKNLLYVILKNLNSIREFFYFIFEKNQMLISSVPEICTAFQLLHRLKQAKLKLIRKFARSKMDESRLSSLAIISIEEQAEGINLDQIVDTFFVAFIVAI